MSEEFKHIRWDDVGALRHKYVVRYPWHKWLNGSAWYTEQGADWPEDMDIEQFRRYVSAYARRWNVGVETKKDPNGKGLWIKATRNALNQRMKNNVRAYRHFTALETRWNELREQGHDVAEVDEWEVGKRSLLDHLRDEGSEDGE